MERLPSDPARLPSPRTGRGARCSKGPTISGRGPKGAPVTPGGPPESIRRGPRRPVVTTGQSVRRPGTRHPAPPAPHGGGRAPSPGGNCGRDGERTENASESRSWSSCVAGSAWRAARRCSRWPGDRWSRSRGWWWPASGPTPCAACWASPRSSTFRSRRSSWSRSSEPDPHRGPALTLAGWILLGVVGNVLAGVVLLRATPEPPVWLAPRFSALLVGLPTFLVGWGILRLLGVPVMRRDGPATAPAPRPTKRPW